MARAFASEIHNKTQARTAYLQPIPVKKFVILNIVY
jgi:hypothetical protein